VSKDFITPEVAMFSLCHSMIFFLEIYFVAPNKKNTFKTPMSAINAGFKNWDFFMRGFKINFQEKIKNNEGGGGTVGKHGTFLYF
jgi:hypothetical protein